ncbi:MAG: hypothetical protein WB767_07845 [Nocardioides sp.]
MSERDVDGWDDEHDDDLAAPARPEPTGVSRVDAVVDAVSMLDDTPLEERVAAFETAHAELRGTLDDPTAAVDPGPTSSA